MIVGRLSGSQPDSLEILPKPLRQSLGFSGFFFQILF